MNDLAKLKDILNKTDITEISSGEKMIMKWRFYKLTNSTVFAALLQDDSMVCVDTVLPNLLMKNHTLNCLTFEENTRQP